MCGIFGYIGKRDATKLCMEGLRRLEYRGYDSAGIAGIQDGKLCVIKAVGKVDVLEEHIGDKTFPIAIAHTRWATHGRPLEKNAHPHVDAQRRIAIVHNGIIENFEELRQTLIEEGVQFVSETDSEIIAHLIALYDQGDFLDAVLSAAAHLEGAFAIAAIHREHPDQIIALAHQSPLAIGRGRDEAFISSDPHAFSKYTREVLYLSHGEVAIVRQEDQEVFNASRHIIQKKTRQLHVQESADISKGEFAHYTLKEIHQQPQTLRNALLSRFDLEYGTANFSELTIDASELHDVQRILIIACGTSYYAGLVASYFFEETVRIPVQVEIASEFRYKHPIVPRNTLVIAVSQSGETADTLAAVREVQAMGAKIVAICNVGHSTLAREADCTLLLRAGPEIGVASTKAFTSQLMVLYLFGLLLGRMRHVRKEEGQVFLEHLLNVSDQIDQILQQEEDICAIAKQTASFSDFFFIGRSYLFPAALEGALKLKEISYLDANGYPAGELKHGPIALVDENRLTVALCTSLALREKMINNIREVKARQGPVFVIAFEGDTSFAPFAEYQVTVPQTIDALAPILAAVVCQLYAYYVALEKKREIDQPRNLAKSVTVE